MPPNKKTCKEIFEYEEENPDAIAKEVGKALGWAAKTVYNCHHYHSKKELLDLPNSEVEDTFSKHLNKDDQALWESFREYGRNVRLRQPWKERVRCHLTPKDGKAYLVGMGDIHIENIMSYIDKLESDLLTLKDTENLGIIVPGDLSDNVCKYFSLSFETLASPADARRLAKMALALIRDKIIAMSSGCHERHSEEEADFNPIRQLTRDWDIPYLGYQGLIELQVGQQEYKVAISHKGRGSSKYNDCHSGVRMIEDVYGDADIVVTAHTHQAAFLNQTKAGKERLFVNIGGYKVADRYSRSRGFPHNQRNLNTPVIELSSDRRHWNIYKDVSILDRLAQ